MQVGKINFQAINNTYTPVFKSHPEKNDNNEADDELLDILLYSYRLLNKPEENKLTPKVFEGMTQKEIDFILDDLYVIAISRGCPNLCKHCYLSAQPSKKSTDNFTSKMPYEDYVDMMKSFAYLKQKDQIIKHYNIPVTEFYFDSDCMDIALYDKQGREHDYTDLHRLFYRAIGGDTVFDTGGWNHKSQKMQQRAEKYVKYLCDNNDLYYQINLSISPFNPLYARAIEQGYDIKKYNINQQDNKIISKGEKLYDNYIDRMANMLFTFTPLLHAENFGIITRPVDNNVKGMEPYSVDAQKIIRMHIIAKLFKMYQEDFKNEQKIIKDEEQIRKYIVLYMEKLNKYSTNLSVSGRFKELLLEKNPDITEEELIKYFKYDKKHIENLEKLKQNPCKENIRNIFHKVIDADGRIYLFDNHNFIPTELQLKLSTNNKSTPEFTPKPIEDFILTKEMINNM